MVTFSLSLVILLLFPSQTPTPVTGKLAYIHAGNVWIKALPDGAARQVSQTGGAEFPQWSPSGDWLVFRERQKTVLVSMAGERIQLDGRDAAWAPREDQLAFIDADGLKIVALGGSRSQEHLVFRNSDRVGVAGFAWSPDGSTFALSVITPDRDGRPEFRVGHLWRINADGTQQKELFTPKIRGAVEPVGWSSDGQIIMVHVDEDFSVSLEADGLPLIAVPANGGETRELASAVLASYDFIFISPTRKDILIVKGAGRETWMGKRLMLADPATGQLAALTDEQAVALSPSWSADGSEIAYVGGPDNKESQHVVIGRVISPRGEISVQPIQGEGDPPKTTLNQRRIWVIGGDGSRRQLIEDSKDRDEYPLWSTDGQSLIFVRVDPSDRSSVWSVGINKGMPLIDEIDMPDTGWFGFYGRMDWYKRLAWFR
jgi:Tol biopolymer transport system component